MDLLHLKAPELDDDMVSRWAALQRSEEVFESPFFHPEFTRCVARERSNIEIAVLSDGQGPLAFWPFERRPGDVAGPPAAEISDYDGAIVSSRVGKDYDARGLMRACGLNAWDYVGRPTPPSSEPGRCKQSESHQIDLSDGYAAYAAQKRAAGSNLFDRVRYYERRLARDHGALRFVLREDRREVFGQLMAWKSAQFVRTEKRDIFASSPARAVLEAIMATDRGGFAGVLSALYAGDRLVAAHFGMRADAVLHYWFPAYDLAFARYSPGLLLLASLVKDADQMGIAKIDLGVGDFPYKTRLGTGSAPVFEGSLYAATWRGQARSVRRSFVRLLKRSPIATPARSLLNLSRRARDR
jgi:CelD/BcsL family acetyltransferase involved in cellulose biosynthesis